MGADGAELPLAPAGCPTQELDESVPPEPGSMGSAIALAASGLLPPAGALGLTTTFGPSGLRSGRMPTTITEGAGALLPPPNAASEPVPPPPPLPETAEKPTPPLDVSGMKSQLTIS